ncbi:outer membrane autotransporter [Escherichia coli]|uniref:Outer membrane autotransporter n=1 Tax=Escherichia coli TaxID=562 RepID=A0A2X1P2Y8_ECOLX|nr:outer membrane autotransporter [Escherichia coli]
MWSSAINTRNNVTTDAGAGFEQTLTGLTLGIDSRFSREESSTIRGLIFGYSHSDIGFDRGGKVISIAIPWGLMPVGSIRTVPMLMGW